MEKTHGQLLKTHIHIRVHINDTLVKTKQKVHTNTALKHISKTLTENIKAIPKYLFSSFRWQY